MKASAKIALVGITLIAIGTGVGVAGGFIAKNNKEGDNHVIYREISNKVTAPTTITVLELGSVEDDINVTYSDIASELEITYDDAEKEDQKFYKVKKTSNALELEVDDDIWKNFLHFTWPWNKKEDKEHKVDVVIPSSMENLRVVTSTVSGNINYNKDGENEVSVNTLSMNTVSGDITAKGVASKGKININGTSGKQTITDCSAKEKIECNSVSGKMIMSNIECGSLSLNTVSGSVDISKLNASNKVEINSVSGSVKLNVVDSKDNYRIEISTVSGTKNVENVKDSTKTKEIDISTTSGSINVTFGE